MQSMSCAGEGCGRPVWQVGAREVWCETPEGGCPGVLPRPPQGALGEDPGRAGLLPCHSPSSYVLTYFEG